MLYCCTVCIGLSRFMLLGNVTYTILHIKQWFNKDHNLTSRPLIIDFNMKSKVPYNLQRVWIQLDLLTFTLDVGCILNLVLGRNKSTIHYIRSDNTLREFIPWPHLTLVVCDFILSTAMRQTIVYVIKVVFFINIPNSCKISISYSCLALIQHFRSCSRCFNYVQLQTKVSTYSFEPKKKHRVRRNFLVLL